MPIKLIWFGLLFSLVVGCATRAPSDYELDRRAGLVPSVEVEERRREAEDLHPVTGTAKKAALPPRSPPRLERIWVYDQELDGGYWLQGTYVFLEVQPGRWQDGAKAQEDLP